MTSSAMPYHSGGHAGVVAVSYSTNAMPTSLSSSTRYPSGSTGTTTSGVGSTSSTKLSSYSHRSSSSFDRPSYYSSGSTSSSGYNSRSSYSFEHRSRYCSPARSLSVSSSSYSDSATGGGGGGGGGGSGLNSSCNSGILSSNNSNRYSLSRDRSENREITSTSLGSLATSAADLYAKYSPANYVPNITASNERNSNNKSSTISSSPSSSSLSSITNGYGNNSTSNNSIFGGTTSNNKISTLKKNSSADLLSSSIIQGRPPRAARKSPVNTVINNHEQQPESTAYNEKVNNSADDNNAPGNNLNGDKSNNNIIIINQDDIINNDYLNVNLNDNYEDKNHRRSYISDLKSHDPGTINGSLKNNRQISELKPISISNSNSNTSTNAVIDRNDLSIGVNNKATCVLPDIHNKKCVGNNLLLFTNNEMRSKTIINNRGDAPLHDNEKKKEEVVNIDDKKGGGNDFDKITNYYSDGTLKLQQSVDEINPAHFYRINNNSNNFIINEDASSSFNKINNDEGEPSIVLRDTEADSATVYSNASENSNNTYHTHDVVRKNIFVSRPNDNNAGDNNTSLSSFSSSSIPSTSRRGDNYSPNGTNTNGSNGIGNNTNSQLPAGGTTQQNIYRGINDQIEGSPTIRAPRNRLQAPRDERCGLNGLRNIGNTCFMNSVIQCLSNTRPLLEYLINEQYLADINTATSSMKGALIKAFSQVIQELWEVGGDHVVNTASLKSQIQRFAPRFIGYSQQDAQEFLRYLLEGLHEDVNRVTVKPQPIHTDIPEHYSDSQKAAESWKRYLRNEDSTIVDVFVGQLRSSLHCTSCGHVSVTLDPFWDLSLPIPTRSGTVKLNQCLEHFTKEEVLDGDEKPTCSKCQMRRKCTKSFSIQKFPKILVIHLKRFSPMERFRGKLNTLVDFPLTGLDLGAFSAPRVAGCTYNLYGVANHSGTTYSGHYTAYCKHPYSGEWHEYNDSRVSSIAARSVVSSEGYVLFYEQQPHSSNL